MGSVNGNLEQQGRQDQLARVARATVAEVTAGDRAITPITISESELSSLMSSDLESLPSLGEIFRRVTATAVYLRTRRGGAYRGRPKLASITEVASVSRIC